MDILRPRKKLKQLIYQYLLPLYIEDYGESNKDEIISRLANTVFIMDSNPIDTRSYIKRNSKSLDKKTIVRAELEYLDFIKKRIIIKKKKIKELKRKLNELLNTVDLETRDFITWFYDRIIESYKRNIPFKLEYTHTFSMDYYEELIQSVINSLVREEKKELVETTFWGKRIQKEINYQIDSDALGQILLDNKDVATTSIVKTSNGEKTVCYIPLIKNIYVNLDRIILHELRHVVETKNHKVGIHSLDSMSYEQLNESRNEFNAILDEKRIKEKYGLIFSMYDFGLEGYDAYFSSKRGLFVIENRKRLNEIAFSDNMNIEDYFDNKKLFELEHYRSKSFPNNQYTKK